MSLSKTGSFLNRLSARLVLSYGVLFIVGLIIVYGLTVFALTQSLQDRMNARLIQEVHEFEERYEKEGLENLKEEFVLEADSEYMDQIFFQLFSPEQKMLATSDLSTWGGVKFDLFEKKLPKEGETFFYKTFDSQRNHKVLVVQKRIREGYIIQVGHTMAEDEVLIHFYKHTFGSVVILMFPLMGLVMWFLTKKTVKGIHQVTSAAEEIARGNLKTRVNVENESTEITLLAKTFNNMSERIEELLKEMRDVTHNIAHDLRSPVTRIRGIAEITLSGSEKLQDYQEMSGTIIEECDNLTSMINILLEIAETDSGISNVQIHKIDLKKIIDEGRELFLPLAKSKQIQLEVKKDHDDALWISANLHQIQRVISNLIDNAIKYTDEGGSILISLEGDADWIFISVTDSGMGIKEEFLEDIFKPFFRSDQSRSTPGNGLGLSFVRSVVERSGGSVSVTSVVNQGSTFVVQFPRII